MYFNSINMWRRQRQPSQSDIIPDIRIEDRFNVKEDRRNAKILLDSIIDKLDIKEYKWEIRINNPGWSLIAKLALENEWWVCHLSIIMYNYQVWSLLIDSIKKKRIFWLLFRKWIKETRVVDQKNAKNRDRWFVRRLFKPSFSVEHRRFDQLSQDTRILIQKGLEDLQEDCLDPSCKIDLGWILNQIENQNERFLWLLKNAPFG